MQEDTLEQGRMALSIYTHRLRGPGPLRDSHSTQGSCKGKAGEEAHGRHCLMEDDPRVPKHNSKDAWPFFSSPYFGLLLRALSVSSADLCDSASPAADPHFP
jgi:hypothetical protein